MDWLIILVAFMPDNVVMMERYPNQYVCERSIKLYEKLGARAVCTDIRNIKNAGE